MTDEKEHILVHFELGYVHNFVNEKIYSSFQWCLYLGVAEALAKVGVTSKDIEKVISETIGENLNKIAYRLSLYILNKPFVIIYDIDDDESIRDLGNGEIFKCLYHLKYGLFPDDNYKNLAIHGYDTGNPEYDEIIETMLDKEKFKQFNKEFKALLFKIPGMAIKPEEKQ